MTATKRKLKGVLITKEMMKIYNYVRYHLYLKPYRLKKKFSTKTTRQK